MRVVSKGVQIRAPKRRASENGGCQKSRSSQPLSARGAAECVSGKHSRDRIRREFFFRSFDGCWLRSRPSRRGSSASVDNISIWTLVLNFERAETVFGFRTIVRAVERTRAVPVAVWRTLSIVFDPLSETETKPRDVGVLHTRGTRANIDNVSLWGPGVHRSEESRTNDRFLSLCLSVSLSLSVSVSVSVSVSLSVSLSLSLSTDAFAGSSCGNVASRREGAEDASFSRMLCLSYGDLSLSGNLKTPFGFENTSGAGSTSPSRRNWSARTRPASSCFSFRQRPLFKCGGCREETSKAAAGPREHGRSGTRLLELGPPLRRCRSFDFLRVV